MKIAVIGKVLLKQHNPRIWIGALRDMVQRGQSYYGMAGVVINLATLYTVREGMIRGYFPWINFFYILLFVLVMALTVIIIDYKVIYPSQIAFHQHEAWKHKSPVRQSMERDRELVNKQMELIISRLTTVENILREIKENKE